MLVALLHQHPPARVDEGHLHEVGADRRGLPVQHAVERERGGLVERPVRRGRRVDEHHLPALAADHVVVADGQSHGEQLELVVLAAGLAAEASHAEGVQALRLDHQAGLLAQLAHRGGARSPRRPRGRRRDSPSARVVQRVVAALLHQQPAARVEDGDGREAMHPATLASPHIRTR